jgi:ABC-type nitrate/sulfonate/bicarbonate transport system substrate-binding protein
MVRLVQYTLASVLVCAGLAACGSGDSASSTKAASGPKAPSVREVTIAQAGGPTAYGVAAYVADQEKIFAKHGLKAKFIAVASGPPIIAAVLSDNTFGTTGVLNIGPAVQAGQDVKFACAIANDESRAVYVRNGLDVPVASPGNWEATVRALKGRTIGVVALASSSQTTFQSIAQAAGMKNSDFKYIAVGGPPTALAALKSKRVDATIGYVGLSEEIEAEAAGKNVLPYRDTPLFEHVATADWATSGKLLTEHPDMAKDFCAAIEEATTFIHTPANLKAVTDILAARLKLTPALAEATAKGDFVKSIDNKISISGLAGSIKQGVDAKLVKPGLTPQDVLWSEAPTSP